jgi:magnesium chelatase family protein
MDRIDLQVSLEPLGAAELLDDEPRPQESSAQVLSRVIAARAAAAERWAATSFSVNARAPGVVLRRAPYRLPRTATAKLAELVDRGELSARGYDRVLRISWTIVDIDGRVSPNADDVAEALQLRTGIQGMNPVRRLRRHHSGRRVPGERQEDGQS